uniref:SAM_MT_RSMB_NOP domain-containing protein n=1 Tax=Rhabditophanes sp. KR3021 TaxID=114890 RepID=A0AC35UDG8_9BILA
MKLADFQVYYQYIHTMANQFKTDGEKFLSLLRVQQILDTPDLKVKSIEWINQKEMHKMVSTRSAHRSVISKPSPLAEPDFGATPGRKTLKKSIKKRLLTKSPSGTPKSLKKKVDGTPVAAPSTTPNTTPKILKKKVTKTPKSVNKTETPSAIPSTPKSVKNGSTPATPAAPNGGQKSETATPKSVKKIETPAGKATPKSVKKVETPVAQVTPKKVSKIETPSSTPKTLKKKITKSGGVTPKSTKKMITKSPSATPKIGKATIEEPMDTVESLGGLELLDSDDEMGDNFSDDGIVLPKLPESALFDGSNDREDDLLPIEEANLDLTQIQEEEFDEFMKEAKSNVEGFVLPSKEEIEVECVPHQLPNLLRERLAGICKVLGGKFKLLCTDGRSRKDYIDAFEAYAGCLYGYNGCLSTRFLSLYPSPDECLKFFEANDNQRPCSIRTNTLKTKKSILRSQLTNRGISCMGAEDWNKSAMIITDTQVAVGATLEYLAGHYFIQGISSMLPVEALAPQPKEKVLDMCAAPAGKTTHMSALMKNTGVLIANDLSKDRLAAVVGNIHRCGATNVVVTNLNACEFPTMYKQYFDRILLDAPCSGTGVIWKDERVKQLRTPDNINHLRSLQRNLLLAAIDSCNANSKTGGYVVYSTCSVLIEENESVVQFALEKRNVKLVPTGIEAGDDGFTRHREHIFHPTMKLCKRFTPHKNNVDGFFVAKLKKVSNDKDQNVHGVVDYAAVEKTQTLE